MKSLVNKTKKKDWVFFDFKKHKRFDLSTKNRRNWKFIYEIDVTESMLKVIVNHFGRQTRLFLI